MPERLGKSVNRVLLLVGRQQYIYGIPPFFESLDPWLHTFYGFGAVRPPQASGKNDAFYRRAKRRIWSQVLGVWLILLVNTIAITTLYFTRIGRSTPVIPMGVHVRVRH